MDTSAMQQIGSRSIELCVSDPWQIPAAPITHIGRDVCFLSKPVGQKKKSTFLIDFDTGNLC